MIGAPKVLRVFPRRTTATPDDDMVWIGEPNLLPVPVCDEVHVSVTFSWDVEQAHKIVAAWKEVHPHVKIGGPAFGEVSGDFIPGRYLKIGNTITSRGCPHRCWFCSVYRIEGSVVREMSIRPGYRIQDSNLLACSEYHIEHVFQMLSKQEERPVFVGGLDATRIKPWIAYRLREIKTERIYCSFDSPSNYSYLKQAGSLLQSVGFTRAHHLYCYVLIGFSGDTLIKAKNRLIMAWQAGFTPFAMLFRDYRGQPHREWRTFQRVWVRPAIVRRKLQEIGT